MNRRGLLGAVLAASVAPAFVKAGVLMPLWVPQLEWFDILVFVEGNDFPYGKLDSAGREGRMLADREAGVVIPSGGYCFPGVDRWFPHITEAVRTTRDQMQDPSRNHWVLSSRRPRRSQ